MTGAGEDVTTAQAVEATRRIADGQILATPRAVATAKVLLAERRALRDALGNAMSECRCSLAERNSGHKVDCWVPEASELLGQWP